MQKVFMSYHIKYNNLYPYLIAKKFNELIKD